MTGSRSLAVMLLGILAVLFAAGSAHALAVGDKAPDFALPPAPGAQPVKLSDLTAKGPVVIYTFIQAFTGT
jgi:AhpC/TSA family